jgi:hypothetical protein
VNGYLKLLKGCNLNAKITIVYGVVEKNKELCVSGILE